MVTTKATTAADIGHPHIRVAQDSSAANKGTRHQLKSLTETPVIALVERDAQLDEAAKALVVARFSRGGRAPYAPDIVFVNEWVKAAFFEAVVRYTVALTTADAGSPVERTKPRGPDFAKEPDVTVLYSSLNATIVDMRNRLVFWE